MENVRCVIANMPRQLLVDIVENMIEESGDIEVVGRVNNIGEIPSVIETSSVDLLVLGMKSSELPESCLSFLDSKLNLTIVGLVDDGRRLAVYLDNVGKNDILKIIRILHRTDGDEA